MHLLGFLPAPILVRAQWTTSWSDPHDAPPEADDDARPAPPPPGEQWQQESAPSPAPPLPAIVKDGGGASSVVVKVGDPVAAAKGRREAAAAVVAAESAAVDVCLAAAAMAGAALLAWWAVAYHPSYAQLWMVPIGLVLAGTPPVVCLALRFSSDSRVQAPPGKGSSGGSAAGAPLVAVVVHK